jgi:hypothetical protein
VRSVNLYSVFVCRTSMGMCSASRCFYTLGLPPRISILATVLGSSHPYMPRSNSTKV